MNIDNTMKELAEYIRMGEEIAANIAKAGTVRPGSFRRR